MLKLTNNASATLAGAITSAATSVVLTAGNGSLFPALGAGEFFYGTLVDSSNNLEVVKVTARTTDTLTVVRAQDGTVARAYSVGDKFELRLVAAVFSELIQRDGSVAMTAALNHGGFKATNVADPTAAQDAATKNYVDTTAVAAVNAEATTRANADAAEVTARNAAIASEASARSSADAGKVDLNGANATGTWGGTTEWTRVNNRPTALSQFTNNLGNYGAFVTGTSIVANSYPIAANCGNINSLCVYKDTGSTVRLGYAAYNCNCNCCC